jgi:hypothetical protein
MAEELFRSADLLVRASMIDGCDRCVVTFDNHGLNPDMDGPGFGEQFLASRGVSAVAVRGRGNHWYQYPDMAAALATVRARLAGQGRVMTYGSSMGGYAALRFADAVGADACLALSPQYTVNPAVAPFEERWEQDATTIAWREEIDAVLRCGCTPVIVYDPAGPDRRHADLIAAAATVRRIALPHAGHPAATYLAAIGLLEPLVMATLDGSLDADAFRAEARRRRRGNQVYLAELARAQPPHRRRCAIALAQQALAMAPDSDFLQHVLATLLTAAGRHGEALPLHARATERSGGFLTYIVGWCAALVEADDRPGALAVARRMVAEHSHYAHVQSQLAHVLWRNRRFDEALVAARRAAAMVPSSEHYAGVVDLYLYRRRPSTRLRKGIRRLLRLPVLPDRPPTRRG